MRGIAFDAMGVLYRSWDDVAELLIPFARENGSVLSDEEIGGLYREASTGSMTSADLWRRLGVVGEARDLDERHLARHELVAGIVDLLEDLNAQGLWLGCISNDLAEWSRALRVRHGLDRRIAHWTVSGEVGARKPDERIFRAFLDRSGHAAQDVTFIDDRPKNVRVAARLGFRTILADFARVWDGEAGVRTAAELRGALAAGVDQSPQLLRGSGKP